MAPSRGATMRSVTNQPRPGEHNGDPDAEPPVADRIHRPAGLDQPSPGFGDAQDQHVVLARQQIARKTDVHAGEADYESQDRVAPSAGEDETGQWHEDDISGVARMVGQHAGQHHAGTSTRWWTVLRLARTSAANRPLRSATPAPSMIVSTLPSGANAVKVRGVSVMSNCSDCSDNRLVTPQRFAGDGIEGRPAGSGAKRGQGHQDRDQANENQSRVGQSIAQPLHAIQKAVALLDRDHLAWIQTGGGDESHVWRDYTGGVR